MNPTPPNPMPSNAPQEPHFGDPPPPSGMLSNPKALRRLGLTLFFGACIVLGLAIHAITSALPKPTAPFPAKAVSKASTRLHNCLFPQGNPPQGRMGADLQSRALLEPNFAPTARQCAGTFSKALQDLHDGAPHNTQGRKALATAAATWKTHQQTPELHLERLCADLLQLKTIPDLTPTPTPSTCTMDVRPLRASAPSSQAAEGCAQPTQAGMPWCGGTQNPTSMVRRGDAWVAITAGTDQDHKMGLRWDASGTIWRVQRPLKMLQAGNSGPWASLRNDGALGLLGDKDGAPQMSAGDGGPTPVWGTVDMERFVVHMLAEPSPQPQAVWAVVFDQERQTLALLSAQNGVLTEHHLNHPTPYQPQRAWASDGQAVIIATTPGSTHNVILRAALGDPTLKVSPAPLQGDAPHICRSQKRIWWASQGLVALSTDAAKTWKTLTGPHTLAIKDMVCQDNALSAVGHRADHNAALQCDTRYCSQHRLSAAPGPIAVAMDPSGDAHAFSPAPPEACKHSGDACLARFHISRASATLKSVHTIDRDAQKSPFRHHRRWFMAR